MSSLFESRLRQRQDESTDKLAFGGYRAQRAVGSRRVTRQQRQQDARPDGRTPRGSSTLYEEQEMNLRQIFVVVAGRWAILYAQFCQRLVLPVIRGRTPARRCLDGPRTPNLGLS